MFSFRTSPIADQLDRGLNDGRVGVFCSAGSWDAFGGCYLHEVFAKRGNLAKVFLPEAGESVPGSAHIAFDIDDLAGLDAVVVEIQDVGSRYFPFTVDVLRLMNALNTLENSPSLYVVDHPNPAGRFVEGSMPSGETDQWTPAVAHRHGLTLGELCHLYADEIDARFPLHIISAEAARTAHSFMPWTIPPASDFPGVFTPYFYSGGSLWTDTNITPGIGTSRPYEFIGAPFLKPAPIPLPQGLLARPCTFVPFAGLYSGETCYGYQLILQPGASYNSLLHTVRLMRHFAEHYSEFHISDGLYGRIGDAVISEYLRGGITFDIVEEHIKGEEQKWIRKAKRYLLYDEAPVRIK